MKLQTREIVQPTMPLARSLCGLALVAAACGPAVRPEAHLAQVAPAQPAHSPMVAGPQPVDDDARGCTQVHATLAFLVPVDEACVVHSKAANVSGVTVTPADVKPFGLKVTNLEASVRPRSVVDAAVAVDVAGAIAFSGTTKLQSYPVTGTQTLASGILHLGRSARLIHVRAVGASVLADVTFDGAMIVNADPLSVRCDSLGIDDGYPKIARQLPPPNLKAWGPAGAGESLRIFASPRGAGESILVNGWTAQYQIASYDGAWVHVIAPYDDGSAITGWVLRSDLELTDFGAVGVGEGEGGCGYLERTQMGYDVGQIEVPAGTTLYAAAGRGPWAHVDKRFVTRGRWVIDGPQDDIELRSLPGLSEDEDGDIVTHAFVRRASVVVRRL